MTQYLSHQAVLQTKERRYGGWGGLGAEVESAGKKPVLPAIKWEERGVPGNLRAKVRSEGG